MQYDVTVVGAGPAGAAVAASCVSVGLRVVLVDPAPEALWPATYGTWTGEAELAHRVAWPSVRVVGSSLRTLDRGYGIVDNDALQARLLGGVDTVMVGSVVGVEHDEMGSTLRLDDGTDLRSVVVVDASGSRSTLVRRGSNRPPAWQVAYGIVHVPLRPPAPAGTCTLMDWTGPPSDDPTFLYAMDLGDGRWFSEETSLARRPALGLEAAERRLTERFERLGIDAGEIVATEEVRIPMGPAVPPAQRVVGMGAAASLGHPATGYSLAASLRVATRLARALVAALERRATPESVARAGWSAVWPAERRRARRLEQYGLTVLLGLDRRGSQRFFDAFFALPGDQWGGYLAGTLGVRGTAAVMGSVFGQVDLSMRLRLAAGHPLEAWSAVSG